VHKNVVSQGDTAYEVLSHRQFRRAIYQKRRAVELMHWELKSGLGWEHAAFLKKPLAVEAQVLGGAQSRLAIGLRAIADFETVVKTPGLSSP
jgi:hypothetical protein